MAAPAHLSRIALSDFRNHARLELAPGAGPVVLLGDNGAGKTNVLEAVSLLAPGSGLRGAGLAQMARSDGPGHFAVAATLETTGGAVTLGTGTDPARPERRRVRIQGAAAAANSLAEWLAVLWLTPAHDRLFTDSAGARRRYLDRLVLALEPGHAAHAARYDAAMRARSKLLADAGAAAAPEWLAALERQMAEHGAAVAAARAATVAALADALASAPETGFPRAAVALDNWAQDTDIAAMLRDRRGIDAAAGRATEGPHRVDLSVTHRDRAMPAAQCSTGEQKALLLGLVLAHAALVGERRGTRPLLLLDEVAAHLDAGRREALFGQLGALGCQAWITGTERALFAGVGIGATVITLAGGAPTVL